MERGFIGSPQTVAACVARVSPRFHAKEYLTRATHAGVTTRDSWDTFTFEWRMIAERREED